MKQKRKHQMNQQSSNDNSSMVAVLTGSTSGFGRQLALLLSAIGATVIISGLRKALGDKVVTECLDRGAASAMYVETDIRSEESVKNLFDTTKKVYGKVTHAFLNAGIATMGNYVFDKEITEEDSFLDIINTNVLGTTYCSRHAFRTINSSVAASFCNGSGMEAEAGFTPLAIYTSSKSYVDSLARSAAVFYDQHKIRSYTISPSVYMQHDTNFEWNYVSERETFSNICNPILADYAGDPKDVAEVVVSLLDGTTTYGNGSNIGCEGPFTYSVHERYQRLYDPVFFGRGTPPIPLDCLKNKLGEKLDVSEYDIEQIHKDYMTSPRRVAAAEVEAIRRK